MTDWPAAQPERPAPVTGSTADPGAVPDPPPCAPVQPGFDVPPARPEYVPPPFTDRPVRPRSGLGLPISILGLGVAAAGAFVLPMETYDRAPGSDISYVQVRAFVADFSGHRFGTHSSISGLATFWWRFGILLAFAALLLLLCAVAAGAAARPIGIAVAGVAVVGGIVHAVTLARTPDYRAALQFLNFDRYNVYDFAAAGIWVAFAGFAITAAGALVLALRRG